MDKLNTGEHLISLIAARTCALKNISLSLPHRAFSVIEGSSGSGKTSLVVGTLYNESLRRLSANLSLTERRAALLPVQPEFDDIQGLLPAVYLDTFAERLPGSLELGTYLGLYAGLTPLFLEHGDLVCSQGCSMPASWPEAVVQALLQALHGDRQGQDSEPREEPPRGGPPRYLVGGVFFLSVSPNSRAKKHASSSISALAEEILSLVLSFQQQGYRRFVVHDRLFKLPELSGSEPNQQQEVLPELVEARKELVTYLSALRVDSVEVIVAVDTVRLDPEGTERLVESLQLARSLGSGLAAALILPLSLLSLQRFYCSEGYFCPRCRLRFPRLTREIVARAIRGESLEASADTVSPIEAGQKESRFALGLSLFGLFAAEIPSLTFAELAERINSFVTYKTLPLPAKERSQSLLRRLELLIEIELGGLTLGQTIAELSTGERLKIVTAAFLGLNVTDTMFILDEPSRVLHPHDLRLLEHCLRQLVADGNTVVATEQQASTLAAAEYAVALTAGQSSPETRALTQLPPSSTKHPAAGLRAEALPETHTQGSSTRTLTISAQGINAPGVERRTIQAPLERIIAVVGTAGSGKTRLLKELAAGTGSGKKRGGAGGRPAASSRTAAVYRDWPKEFGQGTLAELRRNTPAVAEASGVHLSVAQVFAAQRAARQAGLTAEHFLLEKPQGRCRECAGTGVSEMLIEFLGSAVERCSVCAGERFNHVVQSIRYNDKTIGEVYALSIIQAISFFAAHEEIIRALSKVHQLGIGDSTLGSSLGEVSQNVRNRLLLLQALGGKGPSRASAPRIELLDNLLSGLTVEELQPCIRLMREFCAAGGTVFVATHSSELIMQSDLVLELLNTGEIHFFGPAASFGLDQFLR